MSTDLFGQEIIDEASEPGANGKRKRDESPKGYPRRPGSGPAGETCRTCAHHRATGAGRKNYFKCFLLKFRWTHGPGTDIRLKSPACNLWQKREQPCK